ncbi:hypothetical protein RRG08_059845 [Elysia crispata]|uniref:Fucolectin tachylectin-4 pentraxin-1 domain-containing protein n=1 Tax=Elysia crispata TaxID=231223 RepID=A0AAE1CJL4_9GAST|nr:hypothetical protein RRG08_059845 [Elysia crispata]
MRRCVFSLACIFLILKVESSSLSSARTPCEDGWFGSSCQYQCHCAGSGTCDKHDGSCSSGCQQGWFGPACQYASMAFMAYDNQGREVRWLTDKNDASCNNGWRSTLKVTLRTPTIISWVRIVVKDSAKDIRIYLNIKQKGVEGETKCDSKDSAAMVDTRTYDIVCNSHDPVKEFSLFGTGVWSLCSLYISGGRNVALKQKTKQSSTYNTWNSSNAVDGKLDIPDNEISQAATCTHTKKDNYAWWRLTFSQPVDVFKFHIYNRRNPSRKDCCEQRLEGFHLTALGSQRVLYDHIDEETEPANMYKVRPSTRIKDVHAVKIKKGSSYLTLCEVKVFGELSCGDGQYGLGCEQCLAGRYGRRLAETCSETCGRDENLCEQTDGAC